MSKSAVYHKNSFIGEVEIYPKNLNSVGSWIREIRISHLSPSSDRCPPLSILHMISTNGICFKIETKSPTAELFACYSTCIRENKTAVVALADEEIHLVALPFRKNLMQYSCFWGFSVTLGLYNSCLVMLNLRCLGIVFDLDETLIVANTMRSFEDRINVLQQKISNEADPHRIAGMIAEVKRYQEDKYILKQYIENDQVIDNGIVFKVQPEIVQPVSDSHQSIIRPIIRLQDKHIILTRVNPAIRDTSVLVRLRPAWEDLRSYLTARGRKRFEVYVCTMAERDYALEMWRLLDPQSNLISSMELQDRIVCVKPGTKKSLLNVFQGGTCHPKMSLVIDDRLKVWDEKDQPRVHVVPAFAPYYAPQAEANSTIPVLCVARNVACNVRGSFFKEFDEELLPLFTNIFYEDEIIDIPSAPDVGNYLISEDDTSAPNGSKDPIGFEGLTGVEVERRLKDVNCTAQVFPPIVNDYDLRPMPSHFMASSCGALPLAATQVMMPLTNNKFSQSFLPGKPLDQAGISEAALLCSNTEEGEVPESDLDPNTRRRLLILQHGQDMRDPPPHPLPPPPPPPPPSFPFRPPLQFPVPPVQPRGSWLPLEEEINPRQVNKSPKEFPLEPDVVQFDRKQSHHPSFSRGTENPIPSDRLVHEKQRLSVEAHYGDIHARGDIQARGNRPVTNSNIYPGEEMPVIKISSSQRDARFEADRAPVQYSENPAIVLQDIVMKAGGGKVEFRTDLCNTAELQFSVEVWLVGGKISEGIGRTRKEAQHQAVMNALQHLAKKYVSPDQIAVDGHWNKLSHFQENGFTSDSNSLGHQAFSRDDHLPVASTSDSRAVNALVGPTSSSSVTALKELCTMEGYTLNFQVQPSSTGGQIGQQEAHQHAQVEIAGQIIGKGLGKTWEEAKIQAAEEALESLKSMLGQFTHKRPGSPRLQSTTPNKQLKQDLSRALQRIPSSGR